MSHTYPLPSPSPSEWVASCFTENPSVPKYYWVCLQNLSGIFALCPSPVPPPSSSHHLTSGQLLWPPDSPPLPLMTCSTEQPTRSSKNMNRLLSAPPRLPFSPAASVVFRVKTKILQPLSPCMIRLCWALSFSYRAASFSSWLFPSSVFPPGRSFSWTMSLHRSSSGKPSPHQSRSPLLASHIVPCSVPW